MIEVIELILSLIERGAPLVQKLIQDGTQSGELTPAQVQELTNRAEAAFAAPWAQPQDETDTGAANGDLGDGTT
jgi:hypothetical protein